MLNVKVDSVGNLRSPCGFYGVGAEESDYRHQDENGGDPAKHDGKLEKREKRGEIDL